MNLDKNFIPSQLIDMYQKIPDHNVIQYVLMISKGKSGSSESLNFSSEFPKNYLLPKLQEFFDKFTEFETSIIKKDKVIQGHEESIKEQKDYTELALSEKDDIISGYESSIDKLTGHINSIESSKIWKLMYFLFRH